MKMVVLLIFGVCTTVVLANKANLVQLNLMFRHGARTPLKDTYPTDPHIDSNYPPFGIGQLTKTGKKMAYQLGTQIRDRYSKFFGKHYNNEHFQLYSDESVRVQETALLAMAALWRPSVAEHIESDLHWQPVAYHFRDYYPALDGSENFKFQNITEDPGFIQERLEPYRENITFILKESGGDDISVISNIWAAIDPQVHMKISTPEWTKQVYPEILSGITYNLFAAGVFTENLRKNGGCRDLYEWINHMEAYLDGNIYPKSYLYGAHDNNIVVILECLNLRQYKCPDFSANLALELYEEDGDYSVRVVYQQNISHRAKVLTIPGCSDYCPYQQFLELTNKHNGLA